MSTCNCGAGKPLEMPASIKSTPAPFVPSNKDYSQFYKLLPNKNGDKSPLYYMIFGGVIVTLFFLIKR
tara:strand:- start:362 stop:565 length:204 start_codon:yes stop_codon:yes gene_type:complete